MTAWIPRRPEQPSTSYGQTVQLLHSSNTKLLQGYRGKTKRDPDGPRPSSKGEKRITCQGKNFLIHKRAQVGVTASAMSATLLAELPVGMQGTDLKSMRTTAQITQATTQRCTPEM